MKQKASIKRAWRGVDRDFVSKKLKLTRRSVDNYANGLQRLSAPRAIVLESLVGVPAEIMRPDIFRKRA